MPSTTCIHGEPGSSTAHLKELRDVLDRIDERLLRVLCDRMRCCDLPADMTLKEQALARTRPPNTHPGRYQPNDSLVTWLEAL